MEKQSEMPCSGGFQGIFGIAFTGLDSAFSAQGGGLPRRQSMVMAAVTEVQRTSFRRCSRSDGKQHDLYMPADFLSLTFASF